MSEEKITPPALPPQQEDIKNSKIPATYLTEFSIFRRSFVYDPRNFIPDNYRSHFVPKLNSIPEESKENLDSDPKMTIPKNSAKLQP